MRGIWNDCRLRGWGRKAAPYLILEILLPGGTLIALLLFLCRRYNWKVGSVVPENILAACRVAPGASE